MFKDKDGNTLKTDIPLTIGDELVGPDFLRNATGAMLEERGITRVEDPPREPRKRVWPETFEEMRLRLLKDNDTQLLGYLSRTDWAIIRKSELGDSVPEEVAAFRAACRVAARDHEATIGAATTQEELDDFRPESWPHEPGDVDPNATE